MSEVAKPVVEPWLRGSHAEVPAVARGVIHALELAWEDIVKWTEGLSDAQAHAQPPGLPSVGFQLKHIARSVDRLLRYAEGEQLSGEQLTALNAEQTGDEPLPALLAEVKAAFAKGGERVRALAGVDPETFRGVGRKQLPTSVGGLLVHVADHSQRHVGQLVTTVKVVKATSR